MLAGQSPSGSPAAPPFFSFLFLLFPHCRLENHIVRNNMQTFLFCCFLLLPSSPPSFTLRMGYRSRIWPVERHSSARFSPFPFFFFFFYHSSFMNFGRSRRALLHSLPFPSFLFPSFSNGRTENFLPFPFFLFLYEGVLIGGRDLFLLLFFFFSSGAFFVYVGFVFFPPFFFFLLFFWFLCPIGVWLRFAPFVFPLFSFPGQIRTVW